jgi:repressor LexA
MMAQETTARQRDIYEFIRETISARGIPPSMREIGLRFGIRSTNGVNKHLVSLERAGLISRERGTSRGIAVGGGGRGMANVPLLGRVAAGVPLLSPENREGEVSVDPGLFSLRASQRIFALTVRGASMIEAHILDGDTVLVREQPTAENGDIVVALVDGEATVKRFFQEEDRVRLQPENRSMQPLVIDHGELQVLGRVIGVMRKVP